jgi:flagellar motility protein MotE (MotC chaperone)
MIFAFMTALLLSTASAQTGGQKTSAEAAEGRDALMSREAVDACSSDGLRRVAWSLNVREQALARRERLIVQREEDLSTAQQEMQRWIQNLTSIRDEIADMLNVHSDEGKKITSLKDMVENMRPKQAALVLAQLKPGLAVKVIEVMDESKAGKALAVMPPVKAAELAEKLTRPIIVGGKQ